MALGDLQAQVLGALQKLGKASARDIMRQLGAEKQLAYTTISTVLDRLYRKGLVQRSRVIGRGGVKYIYSYATTEDVRSNVVKRALGRLVSAFGPSVVPKIYDSLEELSKEEFSHLRKKVVRRRQ